MVKRELVSKPLPKFERPPVIETVYGLRFTPLQNWRVPHYGLFWQQVADDFPSCEHAAPLFDVEPPVDQMTGLPLPRIWLVGQDNTQLIQMQPGRFLFNWRHRGGAYPGFEAVFPRFFDLLKRFMAFVEERGLGPIEPQNFELIYSNHLFGNDGWDIPRDAAKLTGQLEWRGGTTGYLPAPEFLHWVCSFSFAPEGELLASIKPARRLTDQREFMLLELSARGLPAESPLQNIQEWFSNAHQWIVRGFEDLTNLDAQRELWGKHE